MAQEIPTISVIIPMYNTQEYIEECLTSLLNQTQKNFEVIVVDDCSTDKSLARAEDMQPAFESRNLKLVTATLSRNSGLPGVPRNFGIDLAKGKYIYFVDSDDFLADDALEVLYKAAEEFDAEVVGAEIVLRYEEVDGKFETNLRFLENSLKSKKSMLETFDIAKRIDDIRADNYTNAIWNKLYRRDFLLKNNIKFPLMSFTEDCIVTMQTVICAKNYVRIPFVGYHYRKRESSASTLRPSIAKFVLNLLAGFNFLDNFMQNQQFFIDNPKYKYLLVDDFYRRFMVFGSETIFMKLNLEVEEIFNVCCNHVFNLEPLQNIPMTAYLFASLNAKKLLAQQQAEEIAQLNQLLQSKN